MNVKELRAELDALPDDLDIEPAFFARNHLTETVITGIERKPDKAVIHWTMKG